MAWWLWIAMALAQESVDPPPPTPDESQSAVTAPRFDASDAVLRVRRDGNFIVDDKLVLDPDLGSTLASLRAEVPEVRLVVLAHDEAPESRVIQALRAATESGIEQVALRFGAEALPVGPPLEGEVVDLTGEQGALSAKELRKLKPKRHRLPQNPYAHTDFTAYTLERGETRIGLATITYGLTPRLQLGTVPLLDLVGVLNLTAKANIIRQGRMDYALVGNVYHAPIAKILNRLDTGSLLGLPGKKQSAPKFSASMSWLEVGGRASLRLADKWSAHAGVNLARVTAQGEFSLGKLPNVEIPGFGEIRGDIKVAPRLVGELVQVRLATDYRFNRRDSLILQFSAPAYFAVRGLFSPPAGSVPKEFENLYVAVGYDQFIPFGSFYTASVAWQFSWKHVDLRLGLPLGNSPLGYFQAFDLSYRFGGHTRREEREVRRGYRADKKALGSGGDSD